ncbi:DUF4062 domain-containing protein [Ralstonia psammae]|nr:DUF4062 domain-containing protein [Ralstonia sp. LMG 19083]
MAESRKIIKVFLASPGDVVDERKLAKVAVDEVNQLVAEDYGYQLELVGWEDTTAAAGRPQALINTELERCELFVGIMWKRWGTPPDKNGRFTSGFEEEFRLSVDRYKKDGKPDISLFFKDIDPELTRDPGPGLQRVLDFKQEITDGKEILYETFSESDSFEKRLRRCLVSYLKRLRDAERSASTSVSNAPLEHGGQRANEKEKGSPQSSLSNESGHFLREFLSKVEKGENSKQSARDVARFRLLGTTVGSQENDDSVLGVHDCNLLFSIDPTNEFGETELRALLRAGLEHFSGESAPVWCWLKALGGLKSDELLYRSIIGRSGGRNAAALNAMRLLGERISARQLENRSMFVDAWLSSSSAVKQAALAYLGEYGVGADIDLIRAEYDINDYQTRKSAAEAIVRINLRESRDLAIRSLYELQPTSTDKSLVDSLFRNPESIPRELLIEGVNHSDVHVRTAAVSGARRLGLLTVELAQKLLTDADVAVRLLGLEALVDAGLPVADEQAKSTLVNGVRQPGLLGLGGGAAISYFEKYRRYYSMSQSPADLERLAASPDIIFDGHPYFALVSKRFSKYGRELRQAIDDGFENFIESRIQMMEKVFGEGSESFAKLRNLKKSLVSEFMDLGISLLCEKSQSEDIARVRNALRAEGKGGDFRRDLIEFLGRHGEWSDIRLIVENSDLSDYSTRSLLSQARSEKYLVCADAILSISRGRFADVVQIEMGGDLLAALIAKSKDKDFKSLSDEAIFSFLNSKDDSVRRVAALKLIRVSPRSRVILILDRYLNSGDTWYYNVVHWLDMSISLPRDRVHLAVDKLLTGN